jgi:hypothetical protein
MSNTTFKFFTSNMGGVNANNYVGRTGEVFYDTDGGSPLRLSDGRTPGGVPFSVAGGRQTWNPQFTANGNSVPGIVATGSYVKQGYITHLRTFVDFSGCNAASFTDGGQYQIVLPFPTVSTITLRGGSLHNVSSNSIYHIAGITDIANSNTVMKLYYTGSTTDLAWKNTTPVAATSNASHFDISGAYETNTIFG